MIQENKREDKLKSRRNSQLIFILSWNLGIFRFLSLFVPPIAASVPVSALTSLQKILYIYLTSFSPNNLNSENYRIQVALLQWSILKQFDGWAV